MYVYMKVKYLEVDERDGDERGDDEEHDEGQEQDAEEGVDLWLWFEGGGRRSAIRNIQTVSQWTPPPMATTTRHKK